jgi:hypothetical protein
MPEQPDDGALAASIAGGLARGYEGDHDLFLALLVEALSPALGERLKVERSGNWFRRDGPIRRLRLDLDEYQFTLDVGKGGALTPMRTRVVRAIALKTEELPMEEWLQSVGEAVAEYARHREALDALRRRVW